MNNINYIIKQVTTGTDSLSVVCDLLKSSFPESTKFSLDYLRWQYALNPVGEIVGFNAFDGEVLAAHYVAMPIFMMIGGRKVKGLLSLNTATHPDHRGNRLFSILADKTYSYAAENGFEFVIGVANANSTHGFLKNLGFYLVAPLTVRTGFGKIQTKGDFAFSRYWDEELLNWRLSNPSTEYYSSGDVIYGKRMMGAKDILGVFSDSLVQNAKLPTPPLRPLNLYVGLGADLSSGMYLKLPKFVKISPFNLIFKDLTGGRLPKVTKDNILFQLIDFDVA